MTQGIVIKRNLIIFDSEELWEPIRQKILAEYGASHMISWVMKRELGFTVRAHQHWIIIDKNVWGEDITPRRHWQSQVHLDFLKSPIFGMSQLIGPTLIPSMLQHLKEHMVYWYSLYIYEQTSNAVGVPLDEFLGGKDHDVSAELDRTLAMASQRYMPEIQSGLQGVPPVIQQAQQFLQQFQPPKPQDPTQVLMAETQRKAQADQQAAQVNQLKVQLEQQKNAREAQLDQIKMHENLAVEQAKIQMNTDDNTTAKELAVFEAEHGKHPHFTTGHGIMK